ncbi:MAG TPA: hypothetical protein VFQ44_02340 [Streptosporangiaceae bacterium]|nr:hypothetical protein [Streptosporangiaceae bacterium]
MPETSDRAVAAAVLRAVADLLESRPDLPVPRVDVTYWAWAHKHPAGVPQAIAAVAAAIPCPEWATRISDDGKLLELLGKAPGTSVNICARVEEACTPTGTKTVTTWETPLEIAALVTAVSDAR